MGIDPVKNGAARPEPWLLLDHCDEVVVVTDHAFRLVYMNDCDSNLASAPVEPLIGKMIWDILPRTAGNHFETELRKAVKARQPCVMVADFSAVGHFNIRGFPHGDNAFAIFLREVTARKGGSTVRERPTSPRLRKTDTYPEELEAALREREAAVRDFERGREFQRRFLTEVLTNVTDGRLRLCIKKSDLPALLPPVSESIPLTTPQTLAPFRRRIESAGATIGLPRERTQELIIAAGEAAMNAIVHGGGGTATLHGVPGGGQIQVCVIDTGEGITDDNLHRATLERGYTTAGSLGLGFSLMHSVADRVYLLTRPTGTTVVVEQGAVPELQEEKRFQMALE
ncbi:MAG: ATP-binding protein [Akkermansiaceae bacterium]|nr:ATP-binding protein [Armatimonadota bacterium]